jgi:hypothetical protein
MVPGPDKPNIKVQIYQDQYAATMASFLGLDYIVTKLAVSLPAL